MSRIMLHPSYSDLMKVVNSEVEQGEAPVVNSRYSIVMATSKRARQIISGDEPLVAGGVGKKPLSLAVEELNQGQIKILAADEVMEEQEIYDRAESSEAAADTQTIQDEAESREQEETAAEEAETLQAEEQEA